MRSQPTTVEAVTTEVGTIFPCLFLPSLSQLGNFQNVSDVGTIEL
jgi:hypothetical protein